jgi:crotonobetainyl-CoA:carnitine CoA-transferase CaiB-like acyl-CoA transferase
MASLGEPSTPPVICLPGLGDNTAAIFLAYGIMLALFHRERTEEGQQVHASLLGSLLQINSVSINATLATGNDMPRVSPKSPANALFNPYETRDGRWIHLGMMISDPHWSTFCRATDLQHLENDPRFRSHMLRSENAVELAAIISETMSRKDQSEWAQILTDRKIPWSEIQTAREAASDRQCLENRYIFEFDHPARGKVMRQGLPVQLFKTPGCLPAPSPELGQHTEEALLEAGYGWEEIGKLKDEGVIT